MPIAACRPGKSAAEPSYLFDLIQGRLDFCHQPNDILARRTNSRLELKQIDAVTDFVKRCIDDKQFVMVNENLYSFTDLLGFHYQNKLSKNRSALCVQRPCPANPRPRSSFLPRFIAKTLASR